MISCGNCRHWNSEDLHRGVLGTCRRIKEVENAPSPWKFYKKFAKELGASAKFKDREKWREQAPLRELAHKMSEQALIKEGKFDQAYSYDASGYMSGLNTQASFYCSLHEFREEEEEKGKGQTDG